MYIFLVMLYNTAVAKCLLLGIFVAPNSTSKKTQKNDKTTKSYEGVPEDSQVYIYIYAGTWGKHICLVLV